MREINDIVKEINEKITVDAKFYQLATLQTKDGKTFPAINTGNGQGEKISPENSLQIYHRILDSETETDTNLGKGKFPYQNRIYTMKLVGIGNMRKVSGSYDTNDKIKNEVFDQIPQVLSGKEIIIPGDENIIREDVLGAEFDGINLDKLRLDLIAFSIEYEIKQRICPTRN